MPEEKRKINAWIPQSLYNKLENAGYESVTQALIKAIEDFGEDPQEDTKGSTEDIAGYKQDIEGYKQDLSRIQKDLEKQNQDITGYKQDIKALNNEIERLKEDLARAPDLVEFSQLQARYEGIQGIIREKDRSIERLENDLLKAGQREEDLKTTYNNYFLQVQTLINQKAIGSPKEAIRKKQEETGSNQEENRKFQEESKPTQEKKESRHAQKEEKDLIEKICKNCLQPFFTENPKKETCSDKCRSAYSRRKR